MTGAPSNHPDSRSAPAAQGLEEWYASAGDAWGDDDGWGNDEDALPLPSAASTAGTGSAGAGGSGASPRRPPPKPKPRLSKKSGGKGD